MEHQQSPRKLTPFEYISSYCSQGKYIQSVLIKLASSDIGVQSHGQMTRRVRIIINHQNDESRERPTERKKNN